MCVFADAESHLADIPPELQKQWLARCVAQKLALPGGTEHVSVTLVEGCVQASSRTAPPFTHIGYGF